MRNPYEDDLLSTDWSTMTVGQMWDAIGEFDRHPASEQSGGWNRAFELLDAHRARLEEYRDLAERSWRAPAAEAFLKQVNGLVEAVKTARDAAVSNEPVLPHLSGSMVEARAALEPIQAKWAANQATVAAGAAPPVAGGMQRSAGSPVPDEVLHRQAVTVMQTLSSRLVEGYRAVRIPPLYDPGLNPNPDSIPSSASSAPSSGGADSGGGSPTRPASLSGAPSAGGSPGSPRLSGAAVMPRPAGLGASGGSPPATHGGPGMPPVVGLVIGMVPPEMSRGGSSPGRSSVGGSSQWTRPGARALPPGGVINGPAEGIEPGRSATGVRRSNPVGGVIGPTTGRETEGMFAPAVGGGSGRSGERRLGHNRVYDTDEHWPTPKGVPPVVGLPCPEPVHDPGMPVIGMPPEPRQPRERRDR